MKKLLVFLTATMMIFGLAACSQKPAASTATPTPGGDAPKTEATGNVHVFYYTYSDTYISSVRTALDNELKTAGVNFQDYDSNSSQTTQNEQVQTAITKGANLLVVNIVDTASVDAAQNITNMAKDAGIPVIFFNREIDSTVVSSYEKCVFIGTDAPEAGHMQGQMIADFLSANYEATDLNGDGKISYVMFKGQEGNKEAIYRTQYAVEDANAGLTKAGKPALEFYDAKNANQYLVDQSGNWAAQASSEYMNTILSAYSEANKNMVELVICNNDGMAEGAVSALNTAGYNLGTKDSKTIPVFGVDATDAAKALIAGNKMTGTIKQDAQAMASTIAKATQNGTANKSLVEGLENIDKDVAKVRIHYAIYTGE